MGVGLKFDETLIASSHVDYNINRIFIPCIFTQICSGQHRTDMASTRVSVIILAIFVLTIVHLSAVEGHPEPLPGYYGYSSYYGKNNYYGKHHNDHNGYYGGYGNSHYGYY